MKRHVTLTLRLKLLAHDETTQESIINDLPDLLRSGAGELLPIQTDAVDILAIDDPSNILTRQLDLDAMLGASGKIAMIWQIEDVLNVRFDLSHDAAWQVLQHAKRNHDANIGMNWEYLSVIAEHLFPTSNLETISEDAFADRFEPIGNHLDSHASFDWGKGYGTLFETYGEELEFVRQQAPERIWTLVSTDEDDVIVNGFHIVNRLGYFIASIDCPQSANIQVVFDSDD